MEEISPVAALPSRMPVTTDSRLAVTSIMDVADRRGRRMSPGRQRQKEKLTRAVTALSSWPDPMSPL